MSAGKRDFDKEAANWDAHPVRTKLADDVTNAILDQVALTPGMDVLDFGCGTGLLALRVAPLVRTVTGVDSSRGMLEVLDAKVLSQGRTNVRTRHLQPGERLTGAYDVIVSSMTFHHIEDTGAQLAQLFQAIKDPGYLCLADLDLEQGAFHEDNTGVHHFGFGRAALRQLFLDAGFSIVRDVTAAEVVKPVRDGGLRSFRVFLMVGEKT